VNICPLVEVLSNPASELPFPKGQMQAGTVDQVAISASAQVEGGDLSLIVS
jgi:hypothetical protein